MTAFHLWQALHTFSRKWLDMYSRNLTLRLKS